MKQRLIVVLLLVGFLVATCGAEPTPEASPPEEASGMANPASWFCVEQGYQLEFRDEAGGQVGYCLFPDGSECEEWAFFRGECAPTSESQPNPAQLANSASENCVVVGGTWTIVMARSSAGERTAVGNPARHISRPGGMSSTWT
jgi:putative hemolysin